jgi:hypothetical protein
VQHIWASRQAMFKSPKKLTLKISFGFPNRISEQLCVIYAAACFKFFFGKRSSQNSVFVLTRSIAISAEVFCLRTEGTILVAFVPQPAIQ